MFHLETFGDLRLRTIIIGISAEAEAVVSAAQVLPATSTAEAVF